MGYIPSERRELATLAMSDVESEYYLRLTVKDKSGVIAAVTSILADHRISLEAMQQKEPDASKDVPVIMLTHQTTEGNLQAAISRIITLDAVADEVLILRKEIFST